MDYSLSITINKRTYALGKGISVSRIISINPRSEPKAFDLPDYSVKSYSRGDFIGLISEGASCNVNIHSYIPHTFTHVESSLHVSEDGISLDLIPESLFSGIIFLLDLSELDSECIEIEHTSAIFDKKVRRVAIKSKYSVDKPDINYTNTDPLYISTKVAKLFHTKGIEVLMLDLPSIDRETDKELWGHKYFFENEKRIIIELAYFDKLNEGYYYYEMTPMKIQTDAISTDIKFYPIINYSDQGSS
ncbi:MAG: cyclase family protein [Candidatus Heimdallarchaeota archaeon]|nr:cyclase family protein [Candidatus Heimdallarchaeota archaeon]